MAPDASWLSVLSLLPALSVFLCALSLGARERRLLTLVALGGAIVSALLGLAQISQGPGSPLRFYEGNDLEAVGFFGNRNHLAALLYAAMPFAAAWAAAGGRVESRGETSDFQLASLTIPLIGLCVFVILMAGEVMARSRAGIGLTIVALIASFALARLGQRSSASTAAGRVILAGALAALLLSNFALYRLAERFEAQKDLPMRPVIAETTSQGGGGGRSRWGGPWLLRPALSDV